MRIWFKEWKNNRLIADYEVKDETVETRTHKVFSALEEACNVLDLSKPIWLDSTIRDFKRDAKARFYQESFIDEISFDYLEIHVLEED